MWERGRRWLPILLSLGIAITAAEIGTSIAARIAGATQWANTWPAIVPALLIGWPFVAVGLFASRRRPDNRIGQLMTAVGFGEFASGLWMVPIAVVHTAGLVVAVWFVAVLVHLLMAFPSGRLRGRAERGVVAATYLAVLTGNAILLPFSDTPTNGPPDTPNLLLLHRDERFAALLSGIQQAAYMALLVAVAVVLVRRWRTGTTPQRRALAPVLWAGAACAALTGLTLAGEATGARLPVPIIWLLTLLATLAIPFAFLAGLARIRFFHARALSTLVTGLGDRGNTADLRRALVVAFDDDSVQVAYWLAGQGHYADADGRPVDLPPDTAARVVMPIEQNGQRVGAIIVDAAAVAEETQLVSGVVGAVALAMDNQRLQAELQARVLELEHSRTQIVEASEAQRRRLERNLHDGAQQLLVGVRLRLGLVRKSLAAHPATAPTVSDGDPFTEVGAQVDIAVSDLDGALAELRELARGLHPTLLANRGLAAAVRSLAARAPLPVQVQVDNAMRHRLPDTVESAAYFVVAESLTNITKHAHATRATVRLVEQDGRLLVEIYDDGIGGADPTGSGLHGLAGRVAAFDGRLDIADAVQGGTVIRAEIPLPAGDHTTGPQE